MPGHARRALLLLLLTLIGAGLAPAAWGEPAAQRRPASQVAVVRGGGVFGPVVGASVLLTTVALGLDGHVDVVAVDAGRIVLGTTFVGFTSGNCTGPALLLDQDPGHAKLTRLTGVSPANALLVSSGPAASVTIGSIWVPFLVPACQVLAPGLSTAVTPTAVLLDLAALPGPFSTVLTPGVPGGGRSSLPRLVAVDATGEVLGPAYTGGEAGSADVVLSGGRTPGLARLLGDRFVSGATTAVFEASDCSGAVLVEAPDPDEVGVLPLTALGPDGALHVETGAPAPATVRSLWNGFDGVCQGLTLQSVPVLATTVLLDLTRFVPPFGLR